MKRTVFLPKCYTALLPKQLWVPFTDNHMQLFLCSVWLKGRGSEYLLSSTTPKSYLTSSHLFLSSSCHSHAQVTLWWTRPLQPLSKWHSNPQTRPDFMLSGIPNFLHYLEQATLRIPADSIFPSDFSWEALSDLCLLLPLMHSAGLVQWCHTCFFLTGEPESRFWPSSCHFYVSKNAQGLVLFVSLCGLFGCFLYFSYKIINIFFIYSRLDFPILTSETYSSNADVQQPLKKYVFLSDPSDIQIWVTYQGVPTKCRGVD